MMAIQILLVEDDLMIGKALATGLRFERYNVEWVNSTLDAKSALAERRFSAVILDLGLPDGDGGRLIRAMRERDDHTPILVVTARAGLDDRIEQLDHGADDYLIKPFDLEELCARLRALIRRSAGRGHSVIRLGALTIDLDARTVMLLDQAIDVSAREWAVLLALADRPGAVLSRAQLEARVYGWSEALDSNAIEVHVHSLRKKLGASLIATVRGHGYALKESQP